MERSEGNVFEPPSSQAGIETLEAQNSADSSSMAQSCFIPGTLIRWAWDSTCLGDFKKCPRYYFLKRVEGWTNDTGIHLRWGTEYHKALEDYDRSRSAGINNNDSMHDTVRALLERIEDWQPEPKTKSEELKSKANLLRSVVWYFEHYKPDPAKTLELKNGKPAVELNFNFEIGFGPKHNNPWHVGEKPQDDPKNFWPKIEPPTSYHLCGYLDRVVDFSGDLYVMDRKSTTTTLGSYYFERYDLDNQMSLYTLASQVLLQSPIKGVIIDAVQVAVGFSRFGRGFTYRTPDQLEEWLDQTKYYITLAETCAVNNYWPMNETSCDKYGGCEFRGICGKSPGVRERFLESEFRKEELWNPLKPR
jgi:PD-(D/E)XK nuclease superfamily